MLLGVLFLGTTVLSLKGKGQVSRRSEVIRDILPYRYYKGLINQMVGEHLRDRKARYKGYLRADSMVQHCKKVWELPGE